MNTMTISCLAIDLSLERDVTKRSRLDENITFGDGPVDPACFMKSENKRSSFAPVKKNMKRVVSFIIIIIIIILGIRKTY